MSTDTSQTYSTAHFLRSEDTDHELIVLGEFNSDGIVSRPERFQDAENRTVKYAVFDTIRLPNMTKERAVQWIQDGADPVDERLENDVQSELGDLVGIVEINPV